MLEAQQLPGHDREEGHGIRQAPESVELQPLHLQPVLEHQVPPLHNPAPAVVVEHEQGGTWSGIISFIGYILILISDIIKLLKDCQAPYTGITLLKILRAFDRNLGL